MIHSNSNIENISIVFSLNIPATKPLLSPYIHQSGLVYLLNFHHSLCFINRTICMKERTNCLLTGLLQGTLMNIGELY